jgi:hypothetical protein
VVEIVGRGVSERIGIVQETLFRARADDARNNPVVVAGARVLAAERAHRQLARRREIRGRRDLDERPELALQPLGRGEESGELQHHNLAERRARPVRSQRFTHLADIHALDRERQSTLRKVGERAAGRSGAVPIVLTESMARCDDERRIRLRGAAGPCADGRQVACAVTAHRR